MIQNHRYLRITVLGGLGNKVCFKIRIMETEALYNFQLVSRTFIRRRVNIFLNFNLLEVAVE